MVNYNFFNFDLKITSACTEFTRPPKNGVNAKCVDIFDTDEMDEIMFNIEGAATEITGDNTLMSYPIFAYLIASIKMYETIHGDFNIVLTSFFRGDQTSVQNLTPYMIFLCDDLHII